MRIRPLLRESRITKQFKGYSRKMRPTQGVSYPRSGQSIVLTTCRCYFGESFIYCDTNDKKYCGCESVPCINPDRTFAKNHDFGLQNSVGVPIIPSERYLIQYRSPVRSIVSNYYLFRYRKLLRHRKSEWLRFAINSIGYWNRFVDKWVLNLPSNVDAPFFCSYESIVSDPQVRMREILSYFSDGPLDDAAVCQILDNKSILPTGRISKFRYYDAGFFREIEELTSGRLAKLGLPPFDEGN